MTSELNDYQYWTGKIGSANTEKALQISRVMRMKAMMTYPSKEQYARKLLQEQTEKCLLFCNTIDQAHKMAAHSYTSKNPKSDANLEKFKKGDIDKLSCVLQLSEGVNIPSLKAGIIMHSYGNERKASQRIGRLLRLNPDDVATMHILCYSDTVDEQWTKNALADFDQTKITWK
jgi:superfamily II DNA or RNA helicase